ncbi:MAG: hypothetical protein QW412_01915 [Candidatus Aenigmatarchaeota archaeon]
MKAYIVTTFIGTFGLDDKNRVISFVPFPKDFEKIAEKLANSETEIIEEEKRIQKELWRMGYKEFIFSVRKTEVRHVEPGNPAENFIRRNLRKIAIEKGFVKNQVEFNQLLSKVSVELAKIKIRKALNKDKIVIQVNGAIEEIDKTINVFIERIREWYSLHFPEMDGIVSSHERYLKIIKDFGLRERINEKDLIGFKEKSMGMEFSSGDVEAVQSFAESVLKLYETREKLVKYLEKLLREIAPNFSELATPMLAAKFISKAGSLEKLAKMPSSTIQLLGSEKSLFRYLHGKGKSPKYGILFMHPFVQKASKENKGKVARLIASKLSIAAKVDFYSKEDRSQKLKKELEEKLKEVLKKDYKAYEKRA